MRVKKLKEYTAINEAKAWPPDAIALINPNHNLGKYGGYRWSDWDIDWVEDLPDADRQKTGYIKIKNSGKKWIEGPLMIANCQNNVPASLVRVDKDYLTTPGPEYAIFMKDGVVTDSSKLIGKIFMMDGKEKGIMDFKGEEKKIPEGEYTPVSFHFELTAKFKETVVVFKIKGAKKPLFCALLSDVKNFSNELSFDQREVIGEWFAKRLGDADITMHNKEYRVKSYYIMCDSSDGYPASFEAGPFVTEEQAREVLDSIKKINKYSMFDPSKARVTQKERSWEGHSDMSLDKLIAWCKQVGIDTTMKELVTLRKGAVAAKKFDI